MIDWQHTTKIIEKWLRIECGTRVKISTEICNGGSWIDFKVDEIPYSISVTSEVIGGYFLPAEQYVFGEKPDEVFTNLDALFVRIKELVK